MGTRSTYRIIQRYKDIETKKNVDQQIALVYMQYDGYPSGHPSDAAAWLSTGNVVNGLPVGGEDVLNFNGAGCLAAQFIARYKNGAGGTYLHPFNDRGNCGEDYMYDIIVNEDTKKITFIAYDDNEKVIFKGKPEDFVAKYQEPAKSN